MTEGTPPGADKSGHRHIVLLFTDTEDGRTCCFHQPLTGPKICQEHLGGLVQMARSRGGEVETLANEE